MIIEKFALRFGEAASEFLESVSHEQLFDSSVPYDSEVRSGAWLGTQANFGIGTRVPVLYFVRHGQTDWNAAGRIQGETDVPINALGRSQAARNGGLLAELIPDPSQFAFVASPLLRARETMEIIREALGLPREGYDIDDRLREISFGIWAGRTMPECETAFPDDFSKRRADIWNYAPPEGESFFELNARVMAWLGEHDREMVAVAHGGVCRCLRRHYLSLPYEESVQSSVPQDKVMMIEGGAPVWL